MNRHGKSLLVVVVGGFMVFGVKNLYDAIPYPKNHDVAVLLMEDIDSHPHKWVFKNDKLYNDQQYYCLLRGKEVAIAYHKYRMYRDGEEVFLYRPGLIQFYGSDSDKLKNRIKHFRSLHEKYKKEVKNIKKKKVQNLLEAELKK